MSATRYPVDPGFEPHVVERLHIVDPGGDELVVRRLLQDDDGFVAMLDTGTDPVALDLDDTLSLLSFLADAAGVERYVPGSQPVLAYALVEDTSDRVLVVTEEHPGDIMQPGVAVVPLVAQSSGGAS